MSTYAGRTRTGALGLITGVVLLAPMVTVVPGAAAATTTYGPSGPISIVDRNFNFPQATDVSIPASGSATPYPSTVSASADGTILDLDLQVTIEHSQPQGVDVLLVGPGPEFRRALVLSDAGADNTAVPTPRITLTLDDEAATPVPAATLATGDYQPTNALPADSFPSPAPSIAGAVSALSVFDGMNATGVWSLYVVGDGGTATGKITNWTLDFDTTNKSPQYPSEIAVTGSTAGVSDVDVTLHGFTHNHPEDVDVMLVGPTGQRAVIMSAASAIVKGGGPATGFTLTLDDEAPSPLPDGAGLGTGAFIPANYGNPDDDFPAPAPNRGGVGSALSAFDGSNPNGLWQLFVLDTHHKDEGTFSGGWSLRITTPDVPAAPAISSPANGSLDRDGVVSFSGGAPAGSTVRVLESGTVRGVTTADSAGSWAVSAGGVGDGSHTYTATATDGFGNASAQSTPVTVVMDTVSPTGAIAIAGGAATTRSTSVTLGLTASDAAPSSGLASMRLSNDAATWSAFEPFATSKAWTLSNGDGTKTVYAQFSDAAGNVSGTTSDTIVLETSATGDPGPGAGPTASGNDTTKPRVTSTKPSKRATGVKVSVNVKAFFSEPIRPASIKATTVWLAKPNGVAVTARLTYDPATRSVKINPRNDLARRTTYKVVVGAVRDRAGNVLDQSPAAGNQPKRWRFTTR